MAGFPGFSPRDAAALPLTEETVATVIARTRRANLVQLALAAGLVAVLLLGARTLDAPASWLSFAAATLAAWGLLATALSTWDHVRAAAALRREAGAAIARGVDPARFWRAHRGLFAYFSR